MLEHRYFFFPLPEYAKEKSFSFSENLFIPKVGISSSRAAHPTIIIY